MDEYGVNHFLLKQKTSLWILLFFSDVFVSYLLHHGYYMGIHGLVLKHFHSIIFSNGKKSNKATNIWKIENNK